MPDKSEKNISYVVLEFKEAARHIWNLYFSANASSESLINFEKIEIELFREIVALQLDVKINVDDFRKHPIRGMLVSVKNCHSEFPISVGSRQSNGNIVWSIAETFHIHTDQSFLFFDFFDWNHYGFVDYPFVRCYIERLPQKPEFEGKFGLIEHRYVDFFSRN